MTGKPSLINDSAFSNEFVPTTIFTDPEYSTVGLSEEEAVEKFGADQVACFHRGSQKLESSIGFENQPHLNYMKLVCLRSNPGVDSDTDKIIGMHFLGDNAGEIMQGYTVALSLGMTRKDLQSMVGIHPTVSEEFNNISKSNREELVDLGSC